MIIDFFNKHFNRYNIDNRKTRVYIPSLFIGYLVFIFCLSILLKKIFPVEKELIITIDNGQELNLISTTLFFVFTAVMEEFKYRGLLTKFNYKWVFISLSVLITSIIFLVLDVKVYYLSPESILPMLEYCGFFSTITILTYFVLFKTLFRYIEKIKKIFDLNFNLIILFQIVLFAIWHVLFSGQVNEAHYMSIFIFHFVGALFFTYIRINYGILYSIIVHFSYNFLITIVPILLVKMVN